MIKNFTIKKVNFLFKLVRQNFCSHFSISSRSMGLFLIKFQPFTWIKILINLYIFVAAIKIATKRKKTFFFQIKIFEIFKKNIKKNYK